MGMTKEEAVDYGRLQGQLNHVHDAQTSPPLAQPDLSPIEMDRDIDMNGHDILNAPGVEGEPGPPGDNGEDGREIELQVTATHVQWRYTGGAWANLIALSALTGEQGDPGTNGTNGTNGTDGDDGREVEFQTSATHIQWRYVGESWTNLIALADLKGDQGDPGTDGTNGTDGAGLPVGGTTGQQLVKQSNDDYDYDWETPAGSGDMTKAMYDPNTVEGDAFDMDNMVEGTDTKIMTAAERTKLGNQSGTNTGDQDLSSYQPKPAEGAFANGDKTKLNGIASGATANDTDANLKNRANHTGTQTLATISDAGDLAAQDTANDTQTIATAAFRLDGRANMGTVADQTFTKILFANENYDIGADVASNTFTAPVNGIYIISGSMTLEATASAYRYVMDIRVNGTSRTRLFDDVGGGNSKAHAMMGSASIKLNAGDTVDLHFWHNVGSTRTYGADAGTIDNYFIGALLHAI